MRDVIERGGERPAAEEVVVGVRLFLPLPGPFVAVSKSRAEKIIERRDRGDRREQLAADIAAMPPERQSAIGFAVAMSFVAIIVLLVFAYGGWTWGVGAVGLVMLWLKRLTEKKAAQGLKLWQG